MSFFSNAMALHFNPHSHEGSDKIGIDTIARTMKISIHTPTKGVTLMSCNASADTKLFQSTLPRRE